MNYIDKDTLATEITKISLSNNDITRFGDGFEKAIEAVWGVINKLPIHNIVAKQQPCDNCAEWEQGNNTDHYCLMCNRMILIK